MSEPVSKQRPMIDLDEFERRLGRPVPPAKNSGDPLAELARLVGNTEDRFKNIFQAAPSVQERKPPELGWPARKNARQPEPPPPADDARERINLGGDFAAIEAGLLGTIAPEAETHIASAPKAPPAAQAYAAPAPDYPSEEEDADHWLDAPYAPQAAAPRPAPEPPRSRLPLYATAAIILVGIAGIGGTFALKRSPKGPHEIATIKALAGPTKVQASAATDAGKNDDASILDKSPEPKPTATVNRTEQPVDLAATQPMAPSPPPEPTPTSAQETPTPQPSAPVSPQGSSSPAPQGVDTAAEVPVPPPPAAGSMAGQAFGLAGMIEPKKVRTIAVRPDGSLVSNEAGSGPVSSISPPIPTQAPTQQAPEQQAPVPQTPPPSSDASQTGSLAKTTARVEQPSQPSGNGGTSPAAPAAPSDNASPPNSAPKTTDAKPTDVAETESDTSNADNAQRAESTEGGVFSVQLAAAPTEDEARQTMAHLQGHYGSVLKGHHLKYHVAKVADKKVFRVRVSGLSHGQATTLCQKLQAKGGSCFVAKN